MGQNNFVLDVNVYVSFIAGKKLYRLAKLCEAGILIYSSSALITELEDVLKRPKIKKFLSDPPSAFTDIIREITIKIKDSDLRKIKISSPDKDDNYLFDLAFTTESVLVTGDKELLYWKKSPVAVISLNSFTKLFKI